MKKSLLAVLATIALAGCAPMTSIQPGTSLADVTSKYGRPQVSCPIQGGATRMVWSQQPMGEYAWATTVSKDGKVGTFEQVLTDKNFQRLANGTWTASMVQCQFGPPANIDQFGDGDGSKNVWEYRYKQDSEWFSIMYVYMSSDGSRVLRFSPGPDPLHPLTGIR